ncbi:MAG: Sensor histidine kinase YpdA [Firmicutes bacterium ADurb.Bin193]|nr:MAG: Sensor histidine kinase YpdA [Firmicutes bacterium ADurb.Bin193]
MKLFKSILLLFILLMLFALSGCQVSQGPGAKSSIDIEDGTINLSDWNFNKNGNIKLDGQWAFYWDKLLSYGDIKSGTDTAPAMSDVPQAWTKYRINGQKLPGQGYATYKLHVKTGLPSDSLLSFKLNTFSSAYNIFINDAQIAVSGRVGRTKQQYTPQYKPQIVVFGIPASEFDIIIQVANYDFSKGGFWNSLTMGSPEGIAALQDLVMGKELFVIGALVMLVLYYLSIFLLKRSEKKFLDFALVCCFAILLFDTSGELLLSKLLPGMPFRLLLFIWHASAQLCSAAFVLYVARLFPTRFNKAVTQIFGGVSLALTVVFLLTPPIFYTSFGRLTDYIMLAGIFFGLLGTCIGFIRKMKGGALYLIAVSVLAVAVTHDILLNQNIIKSSAGELSSLGTLLVLFVHTIMHANLFKEQYIEKERLLAEVESTRDEAIRNEVKFLQAQIKPHFLYNTLSVISSLVARDPDKARRLIIKLSEYLRNSFDFDSSDSFVSINKELELVNAYVEIEKARFRDRIEFILNSTDIPQVRIPRLSIQPLVENAIRHGILKNIGGGVVTVNIQKKAGKLNIEVIDNGPGMPKQLAEDLRNVSNDRDGIGIKNIQQRLISLYGKGLLIESEADKGTAISFDIPFCEVGEVQKV